MDAATGPERAPDNHVETKQGGLKCPQCGSLSIAASRRKTSWEEWSSLWGRGYFRCGACATRFSAFCGVGESATYYAKMFTLRRALGRIALVCGIVALVVLITVGVDYMINGPSTAPSFGRGRR